MKIDDILMLARKNKPEQESRGAVEEKIFIPKLNTKMMDSIMRHSSNPRQFGKKEILTIMDLERMSPKANKKGRLEGDALVKAREMRHNFEMSQSLLAMLSDVERSQNLLRTVVLHKIEKELDHFKNLATLAERQKYLERFIKEYISNFDVLRKIFSNQKHDSFIENHLMNLVTKESLDDIERTKKKKELPDEPLPSLESMTDAKTAKAAEAHAKFTAVLKQSRKDLVLKNYETIRNDISSRLTMLEAYHAIDRLLEESKKKINEYKVEKIECSQRIKDYNQERVTNSNI